MSWLARLLGFGETVTSVPGLGYDSEVTPEMLRSRYRRGGIVRALVDARPAATWAGEQRLMVGDSESEELDDLARAHRLWWALYRGDLQSEITGFAGLVVPGGDLMQPPTAEELTEFGLSAHGLDRLQPITDSAGRVARYELNLGYDRAEISGSVRTTANQRSATRVDVLPERVLPIADTRTSDSSIIGEPRLRAAWNLTVDLERVRGGGALAYLRGATGLRQLDFGPEAGVTPEERRAYREELDRLDDDNARTLVTSGGMLTTHSPAAVPFDAQVHRIVVLLHACFRVPLTVTTGEALVAHSASTALTEWHSQIGERRSWVAREQVAPGVAWIESIVQGRGGMVDPMRRDEISVDWAPHQQTDLTERVNALLGAVREGVLAPERAKDLLPEEWFGPVDQRESPDDSMVQAERAPMVVPDDDNLGYGGAAAAAGGEG